MGPRYTDAQKKEILAYAEQHGIPRAAQQFDMYASTIRRWSKPKLKVREFTETQRQEILAYAAKYGVRAAADKYDVRATSITYWNKTRNAYARQVYTEEQIKKILTFARDNGVLAAAREFDVSKFTIARWNKSRHIYVLRKTVKFTQYTPEQKIEMLHLARQMYDKISPDVRSANLVFTLMAKDYDVTVDQLRAWNTRYRIVPGRFPRTKSVTRDEVEAVQQALNDSRGRIEAASRKTGVTHNRIAKMIKNNQVEFKRGEEKIKAGMRVGPNKRRAIGGILSGLLASKSK